MKHSKQMSICAWSLWRSTNQSLEGDSPPKTQSSALMPMCPPVTGVWASLWETPRKSQLPLHVRSWSRGYAATAFSLDICSTCSSPLQSWELEGNKNYFKKNFGFSISHIFKFIFKRKHEKSIKNNILSIISTTVIFLVYFLPVIFVCLFDFLPA